MKFSYYSDLYLKIGKSYWKNLTFIKNRGIVKNRLNFFNDYEIENLKVSLIKLWLNSIDDVSNKSKNHYLNSLNQILKLALEDEVISKNPTIHIKKFKYRPPKIDPFSSDEVLMILQKSKHYNIKFQIFLKIGFFTGMRTGEILSLKMSEVDLKNRVISINSTRSRFGESPPKTIYSIREIPILDILYDDLKYYMSLYKDNFYLLETQYKNPYKDTSVFTYDFWIPILKDLNLKYRRLYNMRHTYATNMLFKNLITPIKLAKLLGHSSPKMIYEVYLNYLNSNLKDFNREIEIY